MFDTISDTFDIFDMTKRERAMSKLMNQGKEVKSCEAQIHTERFDNEEELQVFLNCHDFVTDVVSYGHGCYQVEWME